MALSSGVSVELRYVSRARVVPRSQVVQSRPTWRLPGSNVPGIVVAGTYRQPDREPELWMVRKAEEVLVIDLVGQRYGRVVVQVDDPRSVARAIEVARTTS